MTLYLDPTIPTIAMLGFWLIGGHSVMIPAVNIQSYRCIRRWRVYPTTFLNHASLSSPVSLWAPLLRKKFRRKVFLGRKHSGNDLPLFFFLFLLFFVCLRSFFFFSFNFFFSSSNTQDIILGFSPHLPTTILDISYIFIYVHMYLSFITRSPSWRTNMLLLLLLLLHSRTTYTYSHGQYQLDTTTQLETTCIQSHVIH